MKIVQFETKQISLAMQSRTLQELILTEMILTITLAMAFNIVFD